MASIGSTRAARPAFVVNAITPDVGLSGTRALGPSMKIRRHEADATVAIQVSGGDE